MDYRPLIIYTLLKFKTYKFSKLEKPNIKNLFLEKNIKSFKHTTLYKYNVKNVKQDNN